MKQVQVKNGKSEMVVWTDEDRPLKKGFSVTFKDLEGWWNVEKVWDTSVSKESLYKPWKMGGLT